MPHLERPPLNVLLRDIYLNRAKLVAVFPSQNYQRKDWCGIEFKTISAIIMERNHGPILFVRMDDGAVDGVFRTNGYIDGCALGPAEIARFIQERVDLLASSNGLDSNEPARFPVAV